MAITTYGLLDNSEAFVNAAAVAVVGPWQHSTTSLTDIATLTSSKNVFGFVDGENRAKYFYSSASGSVALPTLSAVPNAVPFGAVPLGSTGTGLVFIVANQISGSTYGAGMMYFQLTPTSGSPDTGSPMQYSIDAYGILLTDSQTTPWV